MTNLYASVSAAKPAPLASTVSRRPFSATLTTVAISARDWFCYIVGLGLLKASSLSATCFGDSIAALLVVRGGLLG